MKTYVCNTVSQEKYDDHLSGLKCLVNKTAQFYGDIIDHYATLKNSRINTTKKKNNFTSNRPIMQV